MLVLVDGFGAVGGFADSAGDQSQQRAKRLAHRRVVMGNENLQRASSSHGASVAHSSARQNQRQCVEKTPEECLRVPTYTGCKSNFRKTRYGYHAVRAATLTFEITF